MITEQQNIRQDRPGDLDPPNQTKDDVAQFLGVTARTVNNLMIHKGLPHYRIGARRVRFRLSEILEWLQSHDRVI